MRQYIARRPQLNMNLKTISMHLVRPNVTLVHLAMMRQSCLIKKWSIPTFGQHLLILLGPVTCCIVSYLLTWSNHSPHFLDRVWWDYILIWLSYDGKPALVLLTYFPDIPRLCVQEYALLPFYYFSNYCFSLPSSGSKSLDSIPDFQCQLEWWFRSGLFDDVCPSMRQCFMSAILVTTYPRHYGGKSASNRCQCIVQSMICNH